jgi:hypothetical protein
MFAFKCSLYRYTAVADLPQLWRDKMQELLGRASQSSLTLSLDLRLT